MYVQGHVLGEEARGGENFCLLGTNFSLKAEATGTRGDGGQEWGEELTQLSGEVEEPTREQREKNSMFYIMKINEKFLLG